MRGRGDDGRVAGEPVRHREAVEEDRQDHDQRDQEDRNDCRARAAVTIVMLMNDCHNYLPGTYLGDTAHIISVACLAVNIGRPLRVQIPAAATLTGSLSADTCVRHSEKSAAVCICGKPCV